MSLSEPHARTKSTARTKEGDDPKTTTPRAKQATASKKSKKTDGTPKSTKSSTKAMSSKTGETSERKPRPSASRTATPRTPRTDVKRRDVDAEASLRTPAAPRPAATPRTPRTDVERLDLATDDEDDEDESVHTSDIEAFDHDDGHYEAMTEDDKKILTRPPDGKGDRGRRFLEMIQSIERRAKNLKVPEK